MAHGYSEDTVDFLVALCDHMCVSDVFTLKRKEIVGKNLVLAALAEDLDRKQWARDFEAMQQLTPPTEDSTMSHEDHVSQALLIASILQFPHLTPPSRLDLATHEQKLKQLKYHIVQSEQAYYWRPLSGALLWCLFVGTLGSQSTPDYPYFMATLLRTSLGLGMMVLEPVRVAFATFHRLAQEQKRRSELTFTWYEDEFHSLKE